MKASNVIEINDTDDYKETNIKVYQRLVGKLIYLSFSTRPNISFAISQLSKRNTNPRVSHLRVTKGIVHYLNDTIQLDIIYNANNSLSHKANNFQLLYGLVSYANSNYAHDPKDRNSMIGHYFFINGVVISWCSKKQQTVLTSTIKVKYIALGHVARESIWIRHFLTKLEFIEPITTYILHGDNEKSIILTKNTES